MTAGCRTLLLFALAVSAQHVLAQSFVYVEPGLASCPAVPAAAVARTVRPGVPLPGSLRVGCGFDKGSYTLSLNSTDPGATFSPKTFIVNFGRLVGNGAFTVRFSTVGVHSVSVAITSNMGSPEVGGRFVSPASEFKVERP
jgi:hypothetical protein